MRVEFSVIQSRRLIPRLHRGICFQESKRNTWVSQKEKKRLLKFLRLSKLPRRMACVDIKTFQIRLWTLIRIWCRNNWEAEVKTLSRNITILYSGCDPGGGHKVSSPFSTLSQIKQASITFMVKNDIPAPKAMWKQNGREAGPRKPPVSRWQVFKIQAWRLKNK